MSVADDVRQQITKRLKELIVREAPRGAEHLLKCVLASVEEFIGAQVQSDDITITIIERP